MGDTEVKKKKNRKKKKKLVTEESANAVKETIELVNNNPPNHLIEILPQKVGCTTMINEMEVTMTHKNSEDTLSKKQSKKKKKKKAKQAMEEPAQEPSNNEDENSPNLLNFSENGGIRLINHPEISVTVNDIPKEVKSSSTDVMKKEESVAEANEAAAASKKKKKKKKKKKNSQSESLPAPPPAEAVEPPASSAPTYVKLPATGDTCVLIVSHESFANGNVPDKAPITKMPSGATNNIQGEKNTITLVNTELSKPSAFFPISLSSVISNETPPAPVNVNNNCSISLTPITNSEPVSNQQGTNVENEPKLSKAELKAERRAKQEAQRAAKAAKSGDKQPIDKPTVAASLKPSGVKDTIAKNDAIKSDAKGLKDNTKPTTEKDQPHQIRLFSHLPQYKTLEILLKQVSKSGYKIHPAVLDIGTQFSRGIVCGSNARCIGLLAAVKSVVKDHIRTVELDFLKGLDLKLQCYMGFLQNCRPHSVSMVNAMKFFKHQINHIDKAMEDSDIKVKLCNFIDEFVRDEILLAKEQIGSCAANKIVDGDVILVFAYSSLVKEVLFKAFHQNKRFQVIVVDSRPKMEALKMLNCLVKEGISCSYTLINAISYAMKDVSKVIIGAHALLSNGYVMSRMGCSQIALVASSYGVPVLVCCETYKFWERVLTDSFVHNELGHPEILINTGKENNILGKWQDLHSLQLLNLLYDVTPPDLVSVVITEKGVLPCTSVPVVLRVRHAGLHE